MGINQINHMIFVSAQTAASVIRPQAGFCRIIHLFHPFRNTPYEKIDLLFMQYDRILQYDCILLRLFLPLHETL